MARMPFEMRFWSKVAIRTDDECWPWLGSRDPKGYGKISGGPGLETLVHRLAFGLSRGRYPTLQVLHHCDNPGCCNPDHVYEGTNKDNVRDRVTRGRSSMGEDHPKARFSDAEVRMVVNLHKVTGLSSYWLSHAYGASARSIRTWIRGEFRKEAVH